MGSLDPFQRPPTDLVQISKFYQKLSLKEIQNNASIIDFSCKGSPSLQEHFVSRDVPSVSSSAQSSGKHLYTSYESKDVSGLVVAPLMLSDDTQRWLLDRLLHRDLANPTHLTNLHKHYHVLYSATRADCNALHRDKCCFHPASFFNVPPSSTASFEPLDEKAHKPLTISQVLNRKLRWITLGGQYDWTNKQYPDDEPPAFPKDVGALVRQHFPEMNPEAAIVNVYSPGDRLSLHRDVSEQCDNGLVSISIGCDALFVVGLEGSHDQSSKYHVLRLRSGDAVYMSGPARYAWHAVPQVMASTCPTALQAWPASGEGSDANQYEAWRGWMATKRVNLNVRQMHLVEYDRGNGMTDSS